MIDFIDANGITHYIEPYSKNAQGARMEQRFFRNPVEGATAQQPAFDPASLMGGGQQPAAQQQQAQQPAAQQPGMAAAQVPPVPGAPGAPATNPAY